MGVLGDGAMRGFSALPLMSELLCTIQYGISTTAGVRLAQNLSTTVDGIYRRAIDYLWK